MKNLIFILSILAIFSCGDNNKNIEHQNALEELKTFSALKAEEEKTKQFIEDYFRDLNSPEWKTRILRYLDPNPEEFLKEYSAFRTSFLNHKATIKHLAIDGNEAIIWMNITANYAATYTFETSGFGDDVIKGIEAKNQELSWDETWYFDMVDGRFGDKWDLLKDYNKILKDLKVKP